VTEPEPRTYYGTVRAMLTTPPSRGTRVLTVVLPAELARTWPAWATHVHVFADADGLHLEPVNEPERGNGGDRPPPFPPP